MRDSNWVWAKNAGFTHKKAGKEGCTPCILDERGACTML